MTKHLFVVGFVLAYFYSSAQKPPSYQITAQLNRKDATIDGLMKLHYVNNSSDTIHYLWFNVYPNAFKSDRTAFSEYMLDKGSTKFYFSEQRNRGYINRLNFRSGGELLRTEDHPLYIDVIKVYLNEPLLPGRAADITTPFHVKVPYNFDGIGYSDGEYILRYWYPAVADHVKPLTNADSSSNTIADYEVQLRVPRNFEVYPNPGNEVAANDSTKLLHYVLKSEKDVSLIINPKKKNEPSASSFNKLKNIFSRPLLPAIGYNQYDGFQLGLLTQNYYQQKDLHYYLAPLYTFKSKSIAGVAGINYTLVPSKYFRNVDVGASASTSSYDDGTNSSGDNVFARVLKFAPYIRVSLPSISPKIEKSLTLKTYIISERGLDFVKSNADSLYYPAKGRFSTRYLNEISFDYSSNRVLYPYSAQLQVQQGSAFYRVNATSNYFFNYPKGGGMNVRVFAAKFGYIGRQTPSEKFATYIYQPKLTAVRGYEDYTYGNYFVGRSEVDGFGGRQMMMRDGGLKIRTDVFADLQGRSDNWIAAVNVNSSLPQFLPFSLPLKLFFDAGTYAEAWDADNTGPRFLYVAGLQLSLFKNIVNVYAPVFYSKLFRDQLKTLSDESKFSKTISFSIDVQRINLTRVFK